MKRLHTNVLVIGAVCITITIIFGFRLPAVAVGLRALQQAPRSVAVPTDRTPLAVGPVEMPDHALVQALAKMDKSAVEKMLDDDFMWTNP